MADLIYRFDPEGSGAPAPPADAASARARLLEGNRGFSSLPGSSHLVAVRSEQFGVGEGGLVPEQRPFASVLACADARVPVELVFGCGANELFVVRVAGNVPGEECRGSLEFASSVLGESVRLTVVLGHTDCGAVTAAVDAYLDPMAYPDSAMLRSVVDRVLPSVCAADGALRRAHGDERWAWDWGRAALIELSVWLNAAMSAMTLKNDLGGEVEYGVFDLSSRAVALRRAPEDRASYLALADELASSDWIRGLLGP